MDYRILWGSLNRNYSITVVFPLCQMDCMPFDLLDVLSIRFSFIKPKHGQCYLGHDYFCGRSRRKTAYIILHGLPAASAYVRVAMCMFWFLAH